MQQSGSSRAQVVVVVSVVAVVVVAVGVVASTQPRDISTAFSHRANIRLLSAFEISGWKTLRSSLLISVSSSKSFQIPAPKPAAIAAPREVVSRIAGRSTGMPIMLACVWVVCMLAYFLFLISGGEDEGGEERNGGHGWTDLHA